MLNKMPKSNNPFAAPTANIPLGPIDDAVDNTGFSLGIPLVLWLFWVSSLIGSPLLMYFEECVVQTRDPEFRIGWPYILPILGCVLLPWIPSVSWSRRFVYFICSISIAIILQIAAVVLLVMKFGITAT